jgi:2-alkyl-3-oxoalkanoate reductase
VKVLVTGAGGFLGSAVVAAAVAAGHEVLALRRPASKIPEDSGSENLIWLSADLRQPENLSESLKGIEGVIHCAAAASGDLTAQLSDTVVATENLLAELPVHLDRFVHVSSFSVYDFDAPGFRGTLSEKTPLEPRPLRRDIYTQTKVIQERLVRAHAAAHNISLVVGRPGAIYGPDKTWDYGGSLSLLGFDLIFAPLSRMRLIHVENCAEALVAALSIPLEGELIVNLVDLEQPSHWHFHRLARREGVPTGRGVPIPYALVLALGGIARLTSRLFLHNRARLPELLDPPRQRARWRPLRYSRARADATLGVSQRISLQAGMAAIASRASNIHPDTLDESSCNGSVA